ncbi:hypothetical protein BN1708_009293 [Verticillium longisporum]|uniref:Uncharacterized protein n=1 Tax=Verticillium longisporum TaxID=100787 RepID=A0A0G4KGQ7_VERLO|nr:hypothetical protein BN1708_009293 [Verticillium longisporum]
MEISREVIAGEVPILPIEGHIELDGEPGILPEFHEPEERDNLDDLLGGNTILVMWSWDHGRKRKLVKGKARQQETIQWRSMWMQHPVRRQGNGREDMKAYTQSCIQELKHFHQNIE